MIRGLPAVAAAAAVDHYPDRAVVAIDLHLDEVVPAADRAELRLRLVARTRDPVRIEDGFVDRDVLALAKILVDAERSRAVAQDLLDLRLAEARHLPRPMTADTGRDPRLDSSDPTLSLLLVRDVFGVQLGRLQIDHAARDVVAAAGLDDHVFRHRDAADRDAVTEMSVRHQLERDESRIARGLRGLLPERLVRLREKRRREERVHLRAHAAGARQHVMVVGLPLEALPLGHGSA